MKNELKAIILGAGKGTRMKSKLPKVLHEIFSKPLLGWVIDSINKLKYETENIVVVGHGAELVENYLNKNYENIKIVEQKEQLGTGHAVAQAVPILKDYKGLVLITCGDTPLLETETLENLINYHIQNNADLTVMSAVFDNPFGYGRIIRDEKNDVIGIVEQKDATEIQKEIKEVNTGVYLLNWEKINQAFYELKNNNAQKEYYLTDIILWAKEKSFKVSGYKIDDNREIYGINSRQNLAVATKYMNEIHLDKLMTQGVTIVDPNSTYISPETTIKEDTVILPNTYIEGKNEIGSFCKIGPMAHLRGGCKVCDYSKIGNFVELKNALIKEHTNACHLTYIGDAQVGANVNIGAGTIFANYNSITKEKKKSVLEDNVSIGSNCVVVAPVNIKQGAFIGALSCITKDVEENSLALTRSPQKQIKDWVKNQKEKN